MNKVTGFSKMVQWATALYLVSFGIYLMLSNHGDFVLWINGHHTPFLDFFFKYWTYLGDGILLGVIGLYFLLTSYFRFNVFMVAVVVQTIFVHIFKQWLFNNEPRPKTFFQDQLDLLHFVDGVNVRGLNAFPSGHTASAFVLAFYLILITKNKALQMFYLMSAILVGFSRVYILQHFARDIYFGSIFGILAVVIAWEWMKKYENKPNWQKGLLKR